MSEAWDKLVAAKTEWHEHLCAGWVCPACGLKRETNGGPDPCLGELPGVDYACCGHAGLNGTNTRGYIAFSNGKVIRFGGAGRVDDVEVDL